MKQKLILLFLLITTISFAQPGMNPNDGNPSAPNPIVNPTSFNRLKIPLAPKKLSATRVMVQDSITKELGWVLKSNFGTGTGTVSSVTGISPITVATGTTTPVIGINQATTSTNGYLSSTDWNTFNGKQSALGYTPEASISSGTTAQYWRGDKTWQTFPTIPSITGLASTTYVDSQDATKLTKSGDIISGDIGNSGTGYFQLPSGTTAQRPSSPTNGMRRYNTTTQRDEFYANGSWQNHARLSGDTFTGAITATNLSGTNTGDQDLSGKLDVASPSYTGLLTGVGTTQTGSSANGIVNLSQTWNTTGNITAIKVNITQSQSGGSSNYLDFQSSGSSLFSVSKSGSVSTGNSYSGFSFIANGGLTFGNSPVGTLSGTTNLITTTNAFNPTSGISIINYINIAPTINQNGGANGITRGLYINPTLTAAADFRGIEVVKGSIVLPYATATSTYAVKTSDYLLNFTSGTFTATLPTAVGCTGKNYILKNSGSGAITIATTSSQTIDLSSTYPLGSQNKYVHLVSDGANWIVTANN